MGNVSTILTNLKSAVASALTGSWSELDYIYDLEKNSFRNASNRYGVGVLDAQTVSGVNRAVTLNTRFFVVLTNTFTNRSGDTNERSAISTLYNQFEEIHKDVFQKKLGSPSVVLLVSDIIMEEPLVVDKGTLSLRGSFNIQHRNNT